MHRYFAIVVLFVVVAMPLSAAQACPTPYGNVCLQEDSPWGAPCEDPAAVAQCLYDMYTDDLYDYTDVSVKYHAVGNQLEWGVIYYDCDHEFGIDYFYALQC